MSSTPPEGYPPSPHDSQPTAEALGMPRSVAVAVTLMWVKIGLAVVSTILTVVMLDSLADKVLAESPEDTHLTHGQARLAVIGVAVVFMLGILAFNLLAIYFVRRGANWARITYTVLAGVVILLTLTGIGGRPGLSMVFSLVGAGLSLASIVFLWRSEANPWFAKSLY